MRWGILGTASISRQIIKAIAVSPLCELGAVASRDLSRARAWAREHGIPHAFGSYDELLRSGKADVIYNPLPNSLHAEWTIRALEAGHPVLCEKPFAANAAQAREVQKVSERTGLHVAEAFMYRYHPVYEKLFELLEEGAIGPVALLHSQFTFMLEDRSAIPASKELAGGALMDVGCYCVNFSRMLAGCEPSRVSAFERRTSVDDTFVGMLEFHNGILADFETSIACAERHTAEVVGTTGAIVLERPWYPGDEAGLLRIERWGSNDEVISVPGANPYLLEIEDFVDVCSGRKEPRWPLQDAVDNMAAIDALYESAGKGIPVSLAAGKRHG
jgi:xylose dehydrogenase (NAD/NADP)